MEPIIIIFSGIAILCSIGIILAIMITLKDRKKSSEPSSKKMDSKNITDASVLRNVHIPSDRIKQKEEPKKKKFFGLIPPKKSEDKTLKSQSSGFSKKFLKGAKKHKDLALGVPKASPQPQDFTNLKNKVLKKRTKSTKNASDTDIPTDLLTFEEAISQFLGEDIVGEKKKGKEVPAPEKGTAAVTTVAPNEKAPYDPPIKTKDNKTEDSDISLSEKEESIIEENIQISSDLTELKTKHEKIDKLFQEKSQSLEKTEKLLKTEQANRKEFNKIKDLLEKELKDVRDKSKSIQTELNDKISENESFLKRINQLEEKASHLEKKLTEKEQSLQNHTNELTQIKQDISNKEDHIQELLKKQEELTNENTQLQSQKKDEVKKDEEKLTNQNSSDSTNQSSEKDNQTPIASTPDSQKMPDEPFDPINGAAPVQMTPQPTEETNDTTSNVSDAHNKEDPTIAEQEPPPIDYGEIDQNPQQQTKPSENNQNPLEGKTKDEQKRYFLPPEAEKEETKKDNDASSGLE